MLDLSTIYSVHCKPANISVALVNSNGISEYSTSTEMCISGMLSVNVCMPIVHVCILWHFMNQLVSDSVHFSSYTITYPLATIKIFTHSKP